MCDIGEYCPRFVMQRQSVLSIKPTRNSIKLDYTICAPYSLPYQVGAGFSTVQELLPITDRSLVLALQQVGLLRVLICGIVSYRPLSLSQV